MLKPATFLLLFEKIGQVSPMKHSKNQQNRVVTKCLSGPCSTWHSPDEKQPAVFDKRYGRTAVKTESALPWPRKLPLSRNWPLPTLEKHTPAPTPPAGQACQIPY